MVYGRKDFSNLWALFRTAAAAKLQAADAAKVQMLSRLKTNASGREKVGLDCSSERDIVHCQPSTEREREKNGAVVEEGELWEKKELFSAKREEPIAFERSSGL